MKQYFKKPGTRHFPRMNYHVSRGLRELLLYNSLSKEEWINIKKEFSHHCAYCGIKDTGNPRTGLVPDHLIPAVEHGDYCIGNIIPACQDCNDQRGKKNWITYIHSHFPNKAKIRISAIRSHLKKHPYNPSIPLSRLTPTERTEYMNIQQEWNRVLTRAQSLRNKIEARRKHKNTFAK